MGDLKYFLGVEVLRPKSGILLNKRKYVLELISELELGGVKPAPIPIKTNTRLTTIEFDKATGYQEDQTLIDIGAYQRLMGKLIYVSITRPNISYTVETLSQFI